MNANMESLLITCMDELDAGVPIEQIIARYPQQADTIRPILQLTASLQSLAGEPIAAARQNSAEMFLTQAAVLNQASRPRPTYWFRRFAVVFGIVIMLFIASLSIVQVASAALPGDPLYGVKRTSENVRLSVARDPERIQTEFATKRAEEVRELLQIGREEEAEYVGIVESIDPEAWLIGGVTVIVDANTKIEGSPAIGGYVEMEGTTRDGVLYASEIEIIRRTDSEPDEPFEHDSSLPGMVDDDDDSDDDLSETPLPDDDSDADHDGDEDESPADDDDSDMEDDSDSFDNDEDDEDDNSGSSNHADEEDDNLDSSDDEDDEEDNSGSSNDEDDEDADSSNDEDDEDEESDEPDEEGDDD